MYKQNFHGEYFCDSQCIRKNFSRKDFPLYSITMSCTVGIYVIKSSSLIISKHFRNSSMIYTAFRSANQAPFIQQNIRCRTVCFVVTMSSFASSLRIEVGNFPAATVIRHTLLHKHSNGQQHILTPVLTHVLTHVLEHVYKVHSHNFQVVQQLRCETRWHLWRFAQKGLLYILPGSYKIWSMHNAYS